MQQFVRHWERRTKGGMAGAHIQTHVSGHRLLTCHYHRNLRPQFVFWASCWGKKKFKTFDFVVQFQNEKKTKKIYIERARDLLDKCTKTEHICLGYIVAQEEELSLSNIH